MLLDNFVETDFFFQALLIVQKNHIQFQLEIDFFFYVTFDQFHAPCLNKSIDFLKKKSYWPQTFWMDIIVIHYIFSYIKFEISDTKKTPICDIIFQSII